MPPFRWRHASQTLRLLVTTFYLAMSMGYAVALLNARAKTGGTLSGLIRHYRGASDGSAYPKEPAELLEVAHAHGFSVPIMYLVLGTLFLGTDVRDSWKRWWMLAPFVSVFIDQGGPWLVRYHAPGWAWVLVAGHGLAGLAFLVLIGVPLWEMWRGSRGNP